MRFLFSLNLYSRGIIIVAFPLLCQLIFLIVLGYFLYETQVLMERETLSQHKIREAYNLGNAITNTLLSDFIAFTAQTGVSPGDQRFQLDYLTRNINAFIRLVDQDPEHQAALSKLRKAMLSAKELLIQTGASVNSPNWRMEHFQYLDKWINMAPECTFPLNQIIATEESKVFGDTQGIEKSINELVLVIVIFAIVSVCIAIGLGFYYATTVRKPLQHISENGGRLSRREPLLPVLAHAAEFSALDVLLHTASISINTSIARDKEVVANAADIISSLDEAGNILRINPYVRRLLGFDPEELIGQPVHALAIAEQSLLAEEFLRKTMNTKQAQVFELRLRTKSGDHVDSRWSCFWSQPHSKMFCVIHDISEQKKVEQLKEDFSNMISHDLRSPLMAMNNSLTLILAGAKGAINEQVSNDLQRAVINIDRLMQLVNDLLDFQKLKAGKVELEIDVFELKQMAQDAVDLLENLAEEKGLRLVIPENSFSIRGDKQKLMQILTNLLSNAIKFSPKGAEVRIEFSEVPDGTEVRVIDCGPGIAEEFRGKIFEPFEQVPGKAKEGTGLGLSICKLIAEAHGGSIRVESRNDAEGSIFVLLLPMH